MTDFWKNLSRSARLGLLSGLAAIVLFLIAGAWWVSQRHQDVLFSNLAPQDAAAMVAELDRMKVPYSLEAGGTTIMVERDLVHKTRLKLMGRDIPLNGAVGFELFNHADFSMTEFAQKVNYQRALQGEITRTILSIDQIKSARVHLALPEETLFKRNQQKPKASITLALKPGQSLRAEQISGIQRLVAAAVPGIAAQDVTIADSSGVALTRANDGEPGVEVGARLDLKKETEQYLAKKAGEVLARTFGAGQALASVDVTLNMDQIKTTTEEVIAAPARAGAAPTGVVVKERESVRDTAAPLDGAAKGSSSVQREIDYQVGRRVEQVVAQPGSIRRLQVVAVVKPALSDEQVSNLKATLAAATGASLERGDTIVVQPLVAADAPAVAPAPAAEMVSRDTLPVQDTGPDRTLMLLGALAVLAAGLAIGFGVASIARRSPHSLTDQEREALLSRVNRWLDTDTPQK